MEEITGRLEDWVVDGDFWGRRIIWGNLYDDVKERWADGQRIHTSPIDATLELEEGMVVPSVYSRYLLGKRRVDE